MVMLGAQAIWALPLSNIPSPTKVFFTTTKQNIQNPDITHPAMVCIILTVISKLIISFQLESGNILKIYIQWT